MRKKKVSGPLPVEFPILFFIWRWKVATTAAIVGRNYGEYGWNGRAAYRRLSKLKQKGYLALTPTGSAHEYVWTLTEAGFKAILFELPALKENGYGCENVRHDLLVQAAHLGEHLPRNSAPHVAEFTEQELRRYDPSCYLEWVPKSKLHRPDGYWYLPRNNKKAVIALEVELSRKVSERYSEIIDFYNCTPTIDAVIWVVSPGIEKTIHPCVKHCSFAFRDIHQFISVEDFKQNGWQSKIFSGSKRGQKFSEFLTGSTSAQSGPARGPAPARGYTHAILDTTLKRVKTDTYSSPPKLEIRLLHPPVTSNAVSQTE